MWRVFIDTGGTFTDCLALAPSGELHRAKVLSTSALRAGVPEVPAENELIVSGIGGAAPQVLVGLSCALVGDSPGSPHAIVRACDRIDATTARLMLDGPLSGATPGCTIELRSVDEAPVFAARLVTATPTPERLPPMELRLATTRGTNALLERRVAPTLLVTTRGFADLLEIGDQRRPELFALLIRKAAPLTSEVIEANERIDSAGRILEPLDLEPLVAAAHAARRRGCTAAAVALMNAWRDPVHEHAIAAALRSCGFDPVECSTDAGAVIRLLPRAQTAVVDAALGALVGGFIDRVQESCPQSRVLVMTSAGGLVDAAAFHPSEGLLSGPAGGVNAAAAIAGELGCGPIISFDMGGTSTDVARFEDAHEYRFTHEVGSVRVARTALVVETVAAGGGSVCGFDGQSLYVGPHSAGADPGPACYGRGGPLTLTDVNLLLGRIPEGRFAIPVDAGVAQRRLEALRADVRHARGPGAAETLLEDLLAIGDERMAEAIRSVSSRRGFDPSSHVLIAFGGAGGLHACAVAERLGIRRVIVPADAGLLSALGLVTAPLERIAVRQLLRPLEDLAASLHGIRAELQIEAQTMLEHGAGGAPTTLLIIPIIRSIASLRLVGQDATIDLDIDAGEPVAAIAARFRERYRELHRTDPPRRALEVESLRVIASTQARGLTAAQRAVPRAIVAKHPSSTDDPSSGNVMTRDELPQRGVTGPCTLCDPHATTHVPAGWRVALLESGHLDLRREGERTAETVLAGRPAEVFAARISGIAEEMGQLLARAALSTNIKERLDFSCGILDARGRLVVNAPHVPVHLGALGVCVRAVLAVQPMGPGETVVTNHPAFGGSHLPDVTVITPVFDAAGRRVAFVASRAHHAEIGGMLPGSMPPAAVHLIDEGVVIAPTVLVTGGVARWDAMESLLGAPPWPSRAVEENLADLQAQLAANLHGAQRLGHVIEELGADGILRCFDAVESSAAAATRRLIDTLPRTPLAAHDELDDATPLAVRIERIGDRLCVDFSGSAPTHPGNFNATPAIVRSAVIYVLRLLVDEPLPLNEGLLDPVDVCIPEGILNPPFDLDPRRCPAVVAGNTETSQRLVNLMLRALGRCADGQGTMNNLLFGNDRFGYYETICGGAGASELGPGADAVHTHMTNTRITDPEVLEQRYPVRVERFAIRRGSGGSGRHRGGNGAIRAIRFLAPMSLAIVAQSRRVAPRGLAGGGDGMPGLQWLRRASGEVTELAGCASCDVEPGDVITIETPGGGGWGAAIG